MAGRISELLFARGSDAVTPPPPTGEPVPDPRNPAGVNLGNTGGPSVNEDSGIGGDLTVLSDLPAYIARQTAAVTKLWERLQEFNPSYYRTFQAQTSNSDGDDFVISLGTPSKGFYWQVRNLVVCGPSLTATVAGSAGVYVAGAPTLTNAIPMNLRDIASFIPAPSFYSRGELVVDANEYLFLVVHGASHSTDYAVSMVAENTNVATPETGLTMGIPL